MPRKKSEKTFEERLLVYGTYLQVATALQHSNRIQMTYKSISSTWILATFIGAGYALSAEEVNLPVHPLLVVSVLCFASSLVILLIWYLDLIVQEKSIASALSLGLDIENENSWLPQVFHNVGSQQKFFNYISMKSVFYLGIITIQSIAITAALGFYLYLMKHSAWVLVSFLALLIVPLFFIFFNRLTRKNDPYPKIKNGK